MYSYLFEMNPKIGEFSNKVIYGAGKEGQALCARLEKEKLDVTYFADSNCQLWGNLIMGKRILSPDELKEMNCDTAVLLSCGYEEQIYGQLKEKGIRNIFLSHVDSGVILDD